MIVALFMAVFVAQASATLGSPGKVEVNAEEGFFSDTGDYILFEWTTDSFDNSCVTLEKEDINARLDEGKVTEDAEICMTNKETKANFQFRDGGRQDVKPIDYLFHTEEWGSSLFMPSKEERIDTYETWASNNCESVDNDLQYHYYYEERQDWTSDVYGDITCTSEGNNVLYHISEIESTPSIEMTNEFSYNGDTKSVGTEQQSVVFSQNGQDIAKFRFKGGYETGWNFPQPDDELVAHDTSTQSYYLINRNWYEGGNGWINYLSESETTRAEQLLDGDYSESRLEELSEQTANDLFGSKYSNSEFYGSDVTFNINGDDPASDSGSLVVKGNQRDTTASAIQVGIKAEEIGYYIPEATPTIENIDTPSEIQEGDRGTVTVTVGNRDDATAQGDFTADVTCNDPFSYTGGSVSVSPDPGESAEVPFQITGFSDSTESSTIDGSCNLEVVNTRDVSETLNRDFSLTLQQEATCENPGDEYPTINDAGNYEIYKCGDEGLEESFVEECDTDQKAEEVSDGDYECVDKSDGQKQEKCGDDIDNDGDGQVDEGCEENQDDEDTGTRVVWIPTQDESSCVSQVIDEGTTVDPSYSSKESCVKATSGATGCAIVSPDFVPYTDAEEFSLICGENKVYANVLLTLIMGLILGGTGWKIGSKFDREDRRTFGLGLGSGLFVLGAVIGFAVISVAQAIGFIVVSLILYLIYKIILYSTGVGAITELIRK